MLIYVQHMQCAGCQVYHKFVDNLGLVEYDLREENGIHEENVVATDSED
jgi:mitochondrial protein import protein ZIM17